MTRTTAWNIATVLWLIAAVGAFVGGQIIAALACTAIASATFTMGARTPRATHSGHRHHDAVR